MKRKNHNAPGTDIPFLTDLDSFYKHVNAAPPLYKDIDIREFDSKGVKPPDYVTRPFRHSFYCITLFLEGDITLNAGFWKNQLNRPAIYIKTPRQVISWLKPERGPKQYFIVFTEEYLRGNKTIADIIFELPFLQLEQAMPLELEQEEVELFTGIYRRVHEEYHSKNPDKFALILTYVQLLLLYVRRLYNKYAASDKQLIANLNDREHLLAENFRSLVRKSFADNPIHKNTLTVKHFAEQLSIHPNHLNAVIKRQTQKTAITILHEQILLEALTLLRQTEIAIKDVSSRLGFADSSHFNKFFKKLTGKTPAIYRKEAVPKL